MLSKFCFFLSLNTGSVIIGVMNLVRTVECRLCCEKVDTSEAEHVLCECPAVASLRFQHFGKVVITPADIAKEMPENLLHFVKEEAIAKLYGLLTLVVETERAVRPITSYNDETDEIEHVVNVVFTEDSIFTMQFLFGFYLIYGTLKEKQAFLFASMLLHLALVAYSSFFVGFAILTMLIHSGFNSDHSLPNGEQIANEALKIPLMMYFAFIIFGRHEELANKSPQLMESVSRVHNDSDPEEIN